MLGSTKPRSRLLSPLESPQQIRFALCPVMVQPCASAHFKNSSAFAMSNLRAEVLAGRWRKAASRHLLARRQRHGRRVVVAQIGERDSRVTHDGGGHVGLVELF